MLDIVVLTKNLSLDGLAESSKLLVATDYLKHIAREQDVIAIGDIYAPTTTKNATNMHTILLAKIELGQSLPHPTGIERHGELGYMDIAIEKLALVEGAFLAVNLGLDIARTEILDEQALEGDGAVLGGAREHNEHNDQKADGYHESGLETAQEIADIENKTYGYDHTHNNGEHEWYAVAIALGPKGFPLFAMVLLHDHGTKEGGYEHNSEQAGDGIGIPMELPSGQKLAGEGKHKGEHKGDSGRGEDGIDNGVDRHLGEQTLPLAFFLTMGVANGELIESFDELAGQMALEIGISRGGKANHVRGKEGGDDGYGHNHRIKEIADNAKRQAKRGNDERELTYLSH